jgi:two-component system phosphate regulon sensor histidine kinase PhoR
VALTRRRDAAEYQTALSICLAIVGNMHEMVNNLLMLARLDARQVALRTDRICLAELIDSAWRPFAEKADQRRITFENHIPLDLACQSDREHLSMVFRNLLGNAAEYTNEAGQIRIAAQRTGDSLQVTVSNTGCKLTAEQVSKVFDSFWRADESRSDAVVHSGLGLALVKRIVTALNGNVAAQIDQPDTFKITLTLP